LFAGLRGVELGENVDAELGRVPELAGDDHRLIVSIDARIERGYFAVADSVDTGEVVVAEILVLLVACVVCECT